MAAGQYYIGFAYLEDLCENCMHCLFVNLAKKQ